MTPQLIICKDSEALALEAAKRFVALAEATIAAKGKFSVVLAGGTTPMRLHQLLATEFKKSVDWSKVFVFFGDERFVPPYQAESNYGMADEGFLVDVPIPDENIFPFVTMDISPEEAAELYQKELERFFPDGILFDLVMLGMGPDGHTASLFPNHAALKEESLVLVIKDSPKPPLVRLTLSFKALNSSHTIMLLAAGESKNKALQGALSGQDLPIARLEPKTNLLWLLDKAAAANLVETKGSKV